MVLLTGCAVTFRMSYLHRPPLRQWALHSISASYTRKNDPTLAKWASRCKRALVHAVHVRVAYLTQIMHLRTRWFGLISARMSPCGSKSRFIDQIIDVMRGVDAEEGPAGEKGPLFTRYMCELPT
jgi:hypothetical protein